MIFRLIGEKNCFFVSLPEYAIMCLIMDFGIQFKVRGDSFGGHFINGISMAESESMLKLKFVSSDKEKSEYISADGYKITAYHTNKNGVFECYTVFENHSNSVVTLEMISSFCLNNIAADTLHRATSFWSAEGKLLNQKLTELNMEPSWSGHGIRIEKFDQKLANFSNYYQILD